MPFPLDCKPVEDRDQIWLRLGQLIQYWELNEALVMMEDIGVFAGVGGNQDFLKPQTHCFQ